MPPAARDGRGDATRPSGEAAAKSSGTLERQLVSRPDDTECKQQRRPHGSLPLATVAVAVVGVAFRLLRRKAHHHLVADSDAVAVVPSAPVPVTLTWSNVKCWLEPTGKSRVPRSLLQGASGVASPGRLVCLMGPSGAGKTTLLNALSGTLPRQKGLHLAGVLRLNGARPPGVRGKVQGYVTQEDALFTQLTVRETLRLAAALRLPAKASKAAKDAAADAVLVELGLARCGDTRVVKISGGERKRLAIAQEMLACPSLLFLDEVRQCVCAPSRGFSPPLANSPQPTSGLDAFSAQSVMQALSGLAKRGHTVVASLHQPRGSVFSLCDDVMLLADGGRPLYFGRAAEAVAHFEAALGGVTKPSDVTAAEWLSDLSAIDTSSPEAEQASRKRVENLVAAWAAKAQTSATGGSGGAAQLGSNALVPVGPQLSWPAQFALLLRRSWRQVTRDKAGLVSRLGSTLSSALIFSSVYWRLNHSQAAIQSRLGLLQVAAVSTTMTSLMKTLTTFSKERRIVARERSGGAYALAPYFCAKLAAELPVSAVFPALFGTLVYPCAGLAPGLGKLVNFLAVTTLESFTSSAIGMAISALVPTTQAALATGPAVAVVFIVFGGSWTSQSTVPAFLRWLPNVSLIKQAFEALCVNELSGASFDAFAPGDAPTGEVVLRRIGFETSTLGSANAQQARIMLANWGLAYAILASRAPRYAQPEEGPS